MKYKPIGILSAGHIATDLNQGALPAMLPFFIAAYDLSYAAAATIVFAVNMSSSVVQPLFGLAADRVAKPFLLPVGMVLAGLGVALTGLFQDYYWILFWGIVSGIGIAAYHPVAARLVNFAAGTRKSSAMSIFGVGGTLGFALGPILVTWALLRWGLEGSLVMLVPVCVMALVVLFQFRHFESLESSNNKRVSGVAAVKENWNGFTKIAVIVSGRSMIFFGLNIFIPIFWIHELGQSKAVGALALSIFAGSGIIGNLFGGNLADRIGPKQVTIIGFIGMTLLLPILLMVDQVQIANLLLVPIGFMLFLTYSPTIVLGQKYLPDRVGLSSGVTLGLSVAVGGGVAPFIGWLADLYGVWTALASVASLPLLFLLFTLTLPEPVEEEVAGYSSP